MTFSDLLLSTSDFSENLHSGLARAGMLEKCRSLEMDHVCVRLTDPRVVDVMYADLRSAGDTISSAQVSGRTIHIVQLRVPLSVGFWKTNGVELPYPKPGHRYRDGWEHAEFVLPGAEPTVESVVKVFTVLFPHISNYEVRTPQVEGDQLPNPTVDLSLDGIGVKFHAHSIQAVVGCQTVV